MLAPVLEGTQFLLKSPCLALSKTWSKKRGLEFLKGSMDIVVLAEIVDAGLCWGSCQQ